MRSLEERDVDRLVKVLDHCEKVLGCKERFGESYQDFLNDSYYRDAAQMNLFQAGEQIAHLTDECRELMGDVPVYQIVGLRNRIAHGYDTLEDKIIWDIMNEDVPDLISKIESFLNDHGVSDF